MSTTAAVENRSSTLVIHSSEALEIDLSHLLKPMDDEFFAFCGRNRELRIEMDKDGEITIMSPAYSENDHINCKPKWTNISKTAPNWAG